MNQQFDLIIVNSQPPSGEVQALDPVSVAVEAWIHNKRQHSDSPRTERAYRSTLSAFRRHLHSRGLDLDSETDLSTYLQVWASGGTPRSKADHAISRATFNHRLAVVSSFYRFALRRKLLQVPNPAEGIDRAEVQAYAKAQPLNPTYVKTQLGGIDHATLAGQRDFALLQVALVTGRRRAELEGLRYGDLRQEGDQTIITWRRAKGGKVMVDALPKAVSAALMRYLHTAYGAQLGTLAADAPVWIALDPIHRGHALTAQAIADICLAHLGTSKVHTTRHTFAHQMEATGAKVSEIQARLGHASMETTGGYLAALRSAYNPHAEELAALFGAE